jgi:hypothetical protein
MAIKEPLNPEDLSYLQEKSEQEEYGNDLKPKMTQNSFDINDYLISEYKKLQDIIKSAPIPKNTEAGPVQYEIAQSKFIQQLAKMMGLDLRK